MKARIIESILAAVMMACLPLACLEAQVFQTLPVGAIAGVANAQEPKPVNSATSSQDDQYLVLTVSSATVRDAQNLPYGRIEQILVHPSSGKIEYAFVANTVFTNIIPKVTPIPWRLLTARSEPVGRFGAPGINQVLQINMEREKLMKAPSFDRRKWPDLTKKDWAHPYLTYYGLEAGGDKKAKSDSNEAVPGVPATTPAPK
ncbi:MAG TPA: hypothetical protein VMZ27_08545 [Candidatus Saccharimonadales bacterium]|nr:hypothetical protein [Candidatus Saccharimonadales bacterium]